MDSQHIKIIKTKTNNYLYSLNRNEFKILNQDDIECLVSGIKEGTNTRIRELIEHKYFDSMLNEIYNPVTPYVVDFLKTNVNTITLQLTCDCNFRCRYCWYASDNILDRTHEKCKMSSETIRKSILFLKNHSSNRKNVKIHFYGGEPMLEFNKIKEAVNYAYQIMPEKEIRYEITTNLSILTQDMIDFLIDKRVNLVISIDGPEKIHNKYRRFASNGQGTFSLVYKNILKLKDFNKEYFDNCIRFNSVVSSEEDKKNAIDFFSHQPFSLDKVSINKIYYDRTDMPRLKQAKQEEQDKEKNFVFKFNLFLTYIQEKKVDYICLPEHEEKGRYFAFLTELGDKRTYSKFHHAGPCLPGQSKLFIKRNGDIVPCENVSDYSKTLLIGTVYDDFNYDKILSIVNFSHITKKECLNCWAIRFCSICPLEVDNFDCFSRETNLKICELQRKKTEHIMKEFLIVVDLIITINGGQNEKNSTSSTLCR